MRPGRSSMRGHGGCAYEWARVCECMHVHGDGTEPLSVHSLHGCHITAGHACPHGAVFAAAWALQQVSNRSLR